MLLSLFNWLTFTWLLALALVSVYQIVKGNRSSVYWVIPVLFIFCGLPLLLDEVIGRVNYINEVGFAIASADEMTSIIYCLYIAVIPVIWLWFGKSKNNLLSPNVTNEIQIRFANETGQVKKRHRFFIYVMLVCPIVIVLFSPDPSQYLAFSSMLRFSEGYEKFQSHVTSLCNLAICAGCYLLAVSRPTVYGRWPGIKTSLPVILLMLIAVWIHGKRNIVAFMVVFLLLALHYRGILRGVRTYILIGVGLIVVLGYSFFFQFTTNRVDTSLYGNARIDFGRDHTVKMTIYAELHPEEIHILEYRGQSILFHLTAFVPREFWPEKPLPYAQYFTSAMFLAKPRMWGWGMTTSWLEEAIANFSWLGMLIGPLLIAIICRVGDAAKSSFVRMLTPLIASLLLVVEATAIVTVIIAWLFFLLRDKWRWKFRLRWGSS
jgi:oligosaccharide repeat unit polymerase